jgi:hypothetical protein
MCGSFVSYGSLFAMASFFINHHSFIMDASFYLFVTIIHGTPKAKFNETHVAYYHNIIID